MRFVLMSNMYFGGIGEDKYGGREAVEVEIGDAVVFSANVMCGKIVVSGELPDGDWEIVPVKVEVA